MSRNDKVALRQESFHNHTINRPGTYQRLQEQWLNLHQLESAYNQEDPDKIKNALAEVDFSLVGYSCTLLRSQLEKAAIQDCAQLIAERILDTSVAEEANKRWETWLSAAPWWPSLAQEYWREAVSLAIDLVITTLADSGIVISRASQRELESDICTLELADLLPPEMYERFFTEEIVSEEAAEEVWAE